MFDRGEVNVLEGQDGVKREKESVGPEWKKKASIPIFGLELAYPPAMKCAQLGVTYLGGG